MIYKGSCHCGSIIIEIDSDFSNIKQCNCSICIRKNAKMNLISKDKFKIIKGLDNLSLYEFGTKKAKHFFCKTCGIYTHHFRKSDPNGIGVNIGCLEGVNPFKIVAEVLNNK
jgi:hypothetical protein